MSFVGSGTTGSEAAQKFLESLQNDFRNLSNDSKKKNPQIKEVRRAVISAVELIIVGYVVGSRQQQLLYCLSIFPDAPGVN